MKIIAGPLGPLGCEADCEDFEFKGVSKLHLGAPRQWLQSRWGCSRNIHLPNVLTNSFHIPTFSTVLPKVVELSSRSSPAVVKPFTNVKNKCFHILSKRSR